MGFLSDSLHGIEEGKCKRHKHRPEANAEEDDDASPGISDQLPHRQFPFYRKFFLRKDPTGFSVISDGSRQKSNRVRLQQCTHTKHRCDIIDCRRDNNSCQCDPDRQPEFRLHRLVVRESDSAEGLGKSKGGNCRKRSSDKARNYREEAVMPHQFALLIPESRQRSDQLLLRTDASAEQDADQSNRQKREHHQLDPGGHQKHVRLFVHKGDPFVIVRVQISGDKIGFVDFLTKRLLVTLIRIDHFVIDRSRSEHPLELGVGQVRKKEVRHILVIVGHIFHKIEVVRAKKCPGDLVILTLHSDGVACANLVFLRVSGGNQDFPIIDKIMAVLDFIHVDLVVRGKHTHVI